MKRFYPIWALAACVLMSVAPASESATLYGADRGSGNLITIDTETGAGAIVGPIGFNRVDGLAFDPTSGILYGVDFDIGQLITIDPSTGAGTPIGGPLAAFNVQGLAFNSFGTLYAVDLSLDILMTIDTTTGVATLVGHLGYGWRCVSSLAYESSSGILYGVDYCKDQLITINTSTGAGDHVGSAPGTSGPGNIAGLAFSPDGILYAVDPIYNQTLTIDIVTGTATVIGPTGFGGLSGLVFSDSVSFGGVEIKVKPGRGDPRCNGSLPVAILGSDTLDVSQIDQTTLSFEGLSVREKSNGSLSCEIEDVDEDGYLDLSCRFKDAATAGMLTGNLLNGAPIEGFDTICVVN